MHRCLAHESDQDHNKIKMLKFISCLSASPPPFILPSSSLHPPFILHSSPPPRLPSSSLHPPLPPPSPASDVSSSDDEAGSQDDSDGDAEGQSDEEGDDAEAEAAEWGVGAMAANPEEEIPMLDETRRCGRGCTTTTALY